MILKQVKLYTFKELSEEVQNKIITRYKENKNCWDYSWDLSQTIKELEKYLNINISIVYSNCMIKNNDPSNDCFDGRRSVAWLYENIIKYAYKIPFEKKANYKKLHDKTYDIKYKYKKGWQPPIMKKEFDNLFLTGCYTDEIFITAYNVFIAALKKGKKLVLANFFDLLELSIVDFMREQEICECSDGYIIEQIENDNNLYFKDGSLYNNSME